MLVTPSLSVRTVKPATAVANQRKVCRRENAGRSRQIAFHQLIHSDIGPARLWFLMNVVGYPGNHCNVVEPLVIDPDSLVIDHDSIVSLATAVIRGAILMRWASGA